MKVKNLMLLMVALIASFSAYAYDYQVASNELGDWNLVTLGGFTLTKSFSVDLAPTNAPADDLTYAINCKIIYSDNDITRPRTDEELKIVRQTGSVLNAWLKDFIAEQYRGAEFDELIKTYISGNFAEDLNDRFPKYVKEQNDALSSDERLDIDTVTVEVEAVGAFKGVLEAYRAEAAAE